MNKLLATSLLSISIVMTGCASIISGSTQTLSFTSVPENANISITNRAGVKVHTGQTPATVTLKKGAGYFKPESYQVTFSKEGYQTKTMTVKGTISGWYFGNILFGGVIGLLAVDPATGAMYSFSSKDVNAILDAQQLKPADDQKTLAVITTSDIPASIMGRAVKIAP